MGCGSSKAVDSASQPTARKVVVKEGEEKTATAAATNTTTTAATNGKIASKDAADLDGIITEDTAGGIAVASEGRPTTPDLTIQGRSPQAKGNRKISHAVSTDGTDAAGQDRADSAASIRSAPTLLERPSSRGGAAFELSYDAENNAKTNMPRRLTALQQRHSSTKKKDLTLDELQSKLDAAENRRKEYEQRLREKMAEESRKASIAQASPARKSRTSENGENLSMKRASAAGVVTSPTKTAEGAEPLARRRTTLQESNANN